MQYWLPFAAAKVKKLEAYQIRQELTKSASRVSSGRHKMARELSGTLAAAIIATRMRKQGRSFFDKTEKGEAAQTFKREFYDRVRRFVNARAKGAGHLRAGFIPAYQVFRVPTRGIPRQKSHGYSKGIAPHFVSEGVVEAFARNAREGAALRYPNAFLIAMPEVEKKFKEWGDEEVLKAGRQAGF